MGESGCIGSGLSSCVNTQRTVTACVRRTARSSSTTSGEMSTIRTLPFFGRVSYTPRSLVYCRFRSIRQLQKDCVCPNDRRSTLLHELIHWQDAQEYQRLYRKITNNADAEAYRDWIKAKSKDILEKLAHKGYNIYEISNYASRMLEENNLKFDETYTEYRTKQYLKR